MNWTKIESTDKLEEIKKISESENILIFKFSPGCSINHVVKTLLEREWNSDRMNMKTFILDTTQQKVLSGKIENDLSVKHETPQVLILSEGKVIFHASHGNILYSEIRKFSNCKIN